MGARSLSGVKGVTVDRILLLHGTCIRLAPSICLSPCLKSFAFSSTKMNHASHSSQLLVRRRSVSILNHARLCLVLFVHSCIRCIPTSTRADATQPQPRGERTQDSENPLQSPLSRLSNHAEASIVHRSRESRLHALALVSL